MEEPVPYRATHRRTIKVGRIYQRRIRDGQLAVPFIRLSGKWLEQAGFGRGDLIDVTVTHGEITLSRSTPPENKFQQGELL